MINLLKKKELTGILQISPHTLDKWIVERRIPFIRLGRGIRSPIRFDEKSIEKWIQKIPEENHKLAKDPGS